jgi:spore germination protein GerM
MFVNLTEESGLRSKSILLKIKITYLVISKHIQSILKNAVYQSQAALEARQQIQIHNATKLLCQHK